MQTSENAWGRWMGMWRSASFTSSEMVHMPRRRSRSMEASVSILNFSMRRRAFNPLRLRILSETCPSSWLHGSNGCRRLSTTHGHITDCKLDSVVYACELMWTCLVWDEQSTPNNFGVPSHWFNSATGDQKGITQTIYTDSQPDAQLINAMRQAEKRKPPIFYIFDVTRSEIELRPPTPRADALTTVLRGGGVITWACSLRAGAHFINIVHFWIGISWISSFKVVYWA